MNQDKKINQKIIHEFANLIGYIEIAINFDSLKKIKSTYEMILDELLKWIKYYYLNKNFDIITHEKSLEIHETLDEIKWEILPDKNIGYESFLTDNILIRYEVIMKSINHERSNN